MGIRTALATVLLLAATTAPAVPAAATAPPDPLATGPHAVTSLEYDAGPAVVAGQGGNGLDGSIYHENLRGVLHVPSGAGPFPVLVFLHGVGFGSCEWTVTRGYPVPDRTYLPYCPETSVTSKFRSYRGFDYLGTNLASHGYLVMSIEFSNLATWEGGGITDAGAGERAELVAQSLDQLAKWDAGLGLPVDGVGDALRGRVDLTRIGLMGHSRGGEGVTMFVDHNRTRIGRRYPLAAVFSLAPIDATRRAPHGVAFATLIPRCDGDVTSLAGTYPYDRGRFADPAERFPRMQFVLRGANHNFFNELWGAESDDAQGPGHDDDPECSVFSPVSARLAAADQRAVGQALMASFLRRYVGGETAFDGFLTGARPFRDGTCGARACADVVATSYLAPAADRLVVTPDGMTSDALGGPLRVEGFTTAFVCDPERPHENFVWAWSGLPPPPSDRVACPTAPTRSAAKQLALRWDGPATVAAAVGDVDVRRFDALTFRTAVNVPVHGSGEPVVEVILRDRHGGAATVSTAGRTTALRAPAGHNAAAVLNGVRLPLGLFAGVDLRRVVSVELAFGGVTPAGSVQLADVVFQRG